MIANYQYKIWKKILTDKLNISQIINELKIAKIFTPEGTNLIDSLVQMNHNSASTKYLICNTEEEPGAFKDRDLILFQSDQLIESILILSFIVKAEFGYIYIKHDFIEQYEILNQKLKLAYANNLLGKDILGSKVNFDLHLILGGGEYICNEITAILRSIEGKRALPEKITLGVKESKLYGSPAIVINLETSLQLLKILDKGGECYFKLNKTNVGGNKIFSVSGHVKNPGNYEVPFGTKFIDLLSVAGGMKHKKSLKAVLLGGITSPVLPANIINNLNLDPSTLIKFTGNNLIGAIIVMDQDTCMVEILHRIIRFYMEGSCGQCTTCREGTEWLWKIINRIALGKGNIRDLKVLENIANNIYGKNLCGFGDRAALSIKSFIQHFHDEFINKIKVGSKVL